MESLEEYFLKCETFAKECLEVSNNPMEYFDSLYCDGHVGFKELVAFRKQLIDKPDFLKNGGYLSIGYFNSDDQDERLACYCSTFDITDQVIKLDFQKRFTPYDLSQPIFQSEPSLFDKIRKSEINKDPDLELISLASLERINESEIVKFNKTYFKFDVALNPAIVSWCENNFKKEDIYVRLSPFEAYDKQPTQRLYESILHPANPKWWKNLSLHLRDHTGASYLLDDCSPKENYTQYIEKHIKGVDKLEVKANRGNDGLLSMMVEELTRKDNHDMVISRVIHMDTDAKFGTPFLEANLKHIDIAIYVYLGANADTRLSQDIATGIRSTEADLKCHLLRVDNIPFNSLFGFVISFLKSQTLINEWITNQFQNEIINETNDSKKVK